MEIGLYRKDNIDELRWETYPGGIYARDFLLPLLRDSTRKFIRNVGAEVQILTVNAHIFPLVIGGACRNNAYVCSPIAQYIHYGKREVEIEFGEKSRMKWIAYPVLNLLGSICRYGKMDEAVFVNNWLLSTNLYPGLTTKEIIAIRDFLLLQFPDRAIVFRSVNDQLNTQLLENLISASFRQIFSRQVYILDPNQHLHPQKRALRIDKKLWEQHSDYHWEGGENIAEWETERIQALYEDLYIGKYSSINPQFTTAFFQESLKRQTFTYRVLRHQEKILAVIGYFVRENVMTNPIVGYDQTYPKKAGLYRMLTLETIREAERLGVIFNMSSGASHFKRLRGACPALEYNMVYDRHLSLRRRMPWTWMKQLTDRVVMPIMRKMGL